jgi:hypothetical protein
VHNKSGSKLDLPFDPGPDDSKPCNMATKTECVVVDPPSCAAL